MLKYLLTLIAKLRNTEELIDVDTELSALRSTQARLLKAKEQQTDLITDAECEKLDLDVELQESINLLQEQHRKDIAAEDANIKTAEDTISEAEAWLNIFPKK